MTKKIVQSTERGQITLPKQWRTTFPTKSYLLEMHEDKIVVIPFNVDAVAEEEVLFDADRDNDGKGVSPEDIITALQGISHG